MQTKSILEGVQESVLHLNHWITAIEQSFKVEMEYPDNNEIKIYRSIYDKLRKHQNSLSRIVRICLNLANKNISSEIVIINENILIVKEKFEQLYARVEVVVKQDETNKIKEKCYNLSYKIKVYYNIMDSFFRLFDGSNKIDPVCQPIKDYLLNLNQVFYQYNLDIDDIQSTITNLGNKIYDYIFTEITFFNKSLVIMETMIETQWNFLINIMKSYNNRTCIPLNEIECISQYIEESCEYVLQYAKIKIESLFNNLDQPEMVILSTMTPEYRYDLFERNIETKIVPWPDGQSEIFSPDFTSLGLLCGYTNINDIKLFFELNRITASMIYHSKVYTRNYTYSYDIKCPPLSCASNKFFPVLPGKYQMKTHVLGFIDSTISILKKKTENTNEILYKNMVHYNEMFASNFERKYEFISDFYFLKSNPNEPLYCEFVPLPKSSFNSSNLIRKEKTAICPQSINIPISVQNPLDETNNRQNIDIYKFVKRGIQFDFSMGCLLLCKEIVVYLVNNFYFNHVIVSMADIFQYTKLSTTV